jgi:2-oxoglutarate dehydrogenase E1 component
VLGFEYGYSLADPNALVLWEGQFGDFANGAQVIIDQFIASGETKWLRMSGLVLLLPHGYEGQGSGTFLGPSGALPAAVRREQHAGVQHHHAGELFPRPAPPAEDGLPQAADDHDAEIAAASSSAVSNLEEFASGTTFRPVIGEIDPIASGDKVERVVICSGKVYYDLLAERRERGLDKVAILRLEQFYPFPEKLLAEQLALYPKAQVIWCQEEPENMGGWTFVDRLIEGVMNKVGRKGGRPTYVGRVAAASRPRVWPACMPANRRPWSQRAGRGLRCVRRRAGTRSQVGRAVFSRRLQSG